MLQPVSSVSAWLRKQLVGAGLPAMQAAPDRALSLASQLPPRSRQPFSSVSAWLRKQLVGAGLPAMQAAPDRALSLASQLPPRSLQPVSSVSAWLRKQLVGLPAMQTAPDRALSLASQLPPRSLQPVSSVSAWLRKQLVGAGLPAIASAPSPPASRASPHNGIAPARQTRSEFAPCRCVTPNALTYAHAQIIVPTPTAPVRRICRTLHVLMTLSVEAMW
jgi:hypothetical protein